MTASGQMNKPLAISIMGPTAAGKTELAINLSKQLNGDIISVDSALIYRDMNIGTAKPSKEELANYPHKLIDILDPSESYSAADFCRDAKLEIANTVKNGKTPVLVGGTMMYFKSLLEGLSPMPASDERIRAHIEQIAKENGWQEVHRRLSDVDPQAAKSIHPNHTHRLSRALEVYLISKKTMTYWQQQPKNGLLDKYNWVQIAVSVSRRDILHKRIEARFDQMLESGFVKEVESLFIRQDLNKELPSIRCVGYRQIWEYLEGLTTYDEMCEKGKAATRQLAKRQFTWLKSWQNLEWIYNDTKRDKVLPAEQVLKNALAVIEKHAQIDLI